MKEKNYQKLMKVFSGVEITTQEAKTIQWLSSWESDTVDNICTLIEKTQNKRQ